MHNRGCLNLTIKKLEGYGETKILVLQYKKAISHYITESRKQVKVFVGV